MKKILLTMLVTISTLSLKSQVVEFVKTPKKADIVLIRVYDPFQADIRVYMTKDLTKAYKYDCMWYCATSNTDIKVYMSESVLDKKLIGSYIYGKIYIVKNEEDRGYKEENTLIENLIRIHRKK